MDQQISQTLWLPPGTCVLNTLPQYAHQRIPAVPAYQQTSHPVLKTHNPQIMPSAIPATSIVPNPSLLQQQNMFSPSQGFVQVPTYENVLVTSDGKHIFEIPTYAPTNIIPGLSLTLPNTTFLPSDIHKSHRIDIASKVVKKKRISPSAKRRSRMRLVAFLEAKKKQQEQEGSSSEITTTSSTPDDGKTLEECGNGTTIVDEQSILNSEMK